MSTHSYMRISKSEMFMRMAESAQLRSSCQRAAVGCVVTTTDHRIIVSMGYNGNARGLPDHCDRDEAGNCGCIHAEVNALIKAPFDEELIMYTTTSPCINCAKLILNSRVIRVIFRTAYRDLAGAELLRAHGVSCFPITQDLP